MNWIRHNLAYVVVTFIAILLIFFTVQLQYLLRDLQPEGQPNDVAQAATPIALPTPLLLQPTPLLEATAVALPGPPLLSVASTETTPVNSVAAPVQNPASAAPVPALSPEELLELEILDATNLTTSEDDTLLVNFIGADAHAVGFIRYSSYRANADKVRAVKIQMADGGVAVEANEASVASGAYPFSRPLILYTAAAEVKAKPHLEGYLGCYLNHLFAEIETVGYTPPSLAMYRDALDSFKATCQRCQMIGSSNPLFPVVPACTVTDIAPAALDITGGSTVYPLSARMGELYQAAGFTGALTIEDIGTSGGFERFCEKGEADLINASRLVKEKEQAQCQAIQRELVAFPVGLDLVVVVVSQQNSFVEQLSMDQLRLLFTTALRWSEINSAWPVEPITRAIPNKSRGTFTFFVEMLYAGSSAAMAGLPATPVALSSSATPTTPAVATLPPVQPTNTPAGQADFRIGYVDQDDACLAATAIMQAFLENELGYRIERVAFPSASALLAALGGGLVDRRIDVSLCYSEPGHNPYFDQDVLTVINENYWQLEGKPYAIVSSRAMSRVFQQEAPCVYSLLKNFKLADSDIRTQSVESWLTDHQDLVQTWTTCR